MEVAPHHQGKTLKHTETDRKCAEIVNFWMWYRASFACVLDPVIVSITFWWNGTSLPPNVDGIVGNNLLVMGAMCLQSASAKIQLVHSFCDPFITLKSEVCWAHLTSLTSDQQSFRQPWAWIILTPISALGSPSDFKGRHHVPFLLFFYKVYKRPLTPPSFYKVTL